MNRADGAWRGGQGLPSRSLVLQKQHRDPIQTHQNDRQRSLKAFESLVLMSSQSQPEWIDVHIAAAAMLMQDAATIAPQPTTHFCVHAGRQHSLIGGAALLLSLVLAHIMNPLGTQDFMPSVPATRA